MITVECFCFALRTRRRLGALEQKRRLAVPNGRREKMPRSCVVVVVALVDDVNLLLQLSVSFLAVSLECTHSLPSNVLTRVTAV